MGLLSTLNFGHRRELFPPYASALFFELWQKSCKSPPYLKVSYVTRC
jgi:hypothetical protein